jgi:uncharacterized protein
VAADDLTTPLGQNVTKKRTLALPIAAPQAIVGALGLFLGLVVLWTVVADDPLGGEPIVVVSTDLRGAAMSKGAESPAPLPESGTGPHRYDGPPPGAAAATEPAAAEASPGHTVTIIDGSSGKREEVRLPSPSDVKPAAKTAATNPAKPAVSPNADPRLLETTRHGSIPKVADGARPADVYAKPVNTPAAKADAPRIALVVGGLGIAVAGTADAISKLPGPVTLAFTPYGNDPDRLVAQARNSGHEVVLQVPMEPFDYPDNDPGPQTLLTSLAPDQNLDRLHWLMSRFQGYVGISNYMGARFTTSEPVFAPVLREAAKRGLIYFDDGSSPRSLAGQIAGANNLPFAKADIVLDAAPMPADMERALSRLEALARDRGMAIGFAAASPGAVDRIAKWAKAANTRGFVLVPLSAAAAKPKA